jgi:hypothetical protein
MLMIDFEPGPDAHVSGEEFVALALDVLSRYNTGNFHDDWLQIRTNHNGLDVEITRNRQIVEPGHRNSHLGVSNPVTMVVNGEVIRHHGEHEYLTQHMRDLITTKGTGLSLEQLADIRREVFAKVREAAINAARSSKP